MRRKQDTGHVTSAVSSKHRIGFGYVFLFFPGVADRSKFSSAVVIIYLYGETGFCLVQLVPVVIRSAQVSLLNLQNVTCPMLRGYCLRLSFASLLGPALPSSCHQLGEVNIALSCSVNEISAHQINYEKIICFVHFYLMAFPSRDKISFPSSNY